MNYQTKLLFVLSLLFFFCHQAYSQNNCLKTFKSTKNVKITNLQTGHFNIIAPSIPTRYNCYTVSLQQQQIPQKLTVILSIALISNYEDKPATDFSIKSLTTTNTSFTALFTISTTAKWTQTHIHYLATSRDDIICGTFIAISDQLLKPSNQTKTLTLYSTIDSKYKQFLNHSKDKTDLLLAYPFITGITTLDQYYTITLIKGGTLFNNDGISINIQLSNNSQPIQTLYLTYIGFDLYGSVKIQMAIFDQNNLDFIIRDQINTQENDQYQINGMMAISGSAQQLLYRLGVVNTSPRRLLAPYVYNATAMYDGLSSYEIRVFKKAFQIEQLDFVSDAYLQPILRSPLIPSALQPLIDGNICVSYDSCISNGGKVVLLNLSRGCILCAPNKIFNYDTQQCQCPKGMMPSVGDKCVKQTQFCGQGNIYINGSCYQLVKIKDICNESNNEIFDQKSQKCTCNNGFLSNLIPQTNKIICAPNCPSGTLYNNISKLCQCPIGYNFNLKTCIKCQTSQQWDDLKKICICKLPSVMTKNGTCLTCSGFTVVNKQQNKCQCQKGYIGNGNICRPATDPKLKSSVADVVYASKFPPNP